jgi:glycine/D-amino acid oxidase-like deaminating enzyme
MSDKPVDVIVIGAGVVGCNTAWQLRARGLSVAVVEARATAASQASQGAAGFVASWSGFYVAYWGHTEWQMQQYGKEFYRRFAAQCDEDIGFYPSGIAFVYLDPAVWEQLQARIEESRRWGTQLEVLGREQAATLLPEIRYDEVVAILFETDAIRLRAGDAVRAMARQLAADGVQFSFDTRVTGFIHSDDRVVGVTTDRGDLRADHVVVTAGAWSRPLIERLGVPCPANPDPRARYTTRPLPGVREDMPLVIFPAFQNHTIYLREERGGLLIGGGTAGQTFPSYRAINPSDPPPAEDVPVDRAYSARQALPLLERAMPILHDADVDQTRGCLPGYTDDRKFILGLVPGQPGLSVFCACHEGGVTHGPGIGRSLAELIVDGQTTWDITPYRLERFAPLPLR